MKPTNCRSNWKSCAAAATIAALTLLCAGCPSVPYSQPGYLILSRGQTYTAPMNETWASLQVVQEKDQQILLLQETIRKIQARESLEKR